jgi:mevalonate kinase
MVPFSAKGWQMPFGRAPGKVILLGEHAVVYGFPAIAVPVTEVQAQAHVEAGPPGQGVVVLAPDLGRRIVVREAELDEPLASIVHLTLRRLKQAPDPDLTVTVRSTVPMARGMGSGAAVSTAIVRGLAKYYGAWLASQAVSDLVYETEVIYHGTPSGIDNAVVSFEKPVHFAKDRLCEVFWVGEPFLLMVADTGIESPTKEVVGDLGRRYAAEPERYRPLFERVGEIAVQGRGAIEAGQLRALGTLMDENHGLLQEMGISCPELDSLVAAARREGALGAKLSGAGWGGNMIALVTAETEGCVGMALRLAGAERVIATEVQ